MLTEDQKIEIRRHLGYPVLGNQRGLGYRFHQEFGQLDFRLQTMQVFEECSITGRSAGFIRISSSQVDSFAALGAGIEMSIGFILDGNLVAILSYTTQADDTIFTIAQQFQHAQSGSPELVDATFNTFAQVPDPLGARRPLQEFPGLQISCARDFVLTTSSVDPVGLVVTPGSGGFFSPKAFIDEVEVRGFIPILNILEGKIATVSDDLDTDKADVWTANKNQMKDRESLYDRWRQKLSQYVNIPLFEDTPHQARYMRSTSKSRSGRMIA